MKYMTIITFILVLQTAASIINAIQYTTSYSIDPYPEAFSSIDKGTIENSQYLQSPAQVDASSDIGLGDFVKGLFIFIGQFAWGIIAIPVVLHNFGMEWNLAYLFSYPIYLVYFIALFQIISNRAAKTMV